MTWTISGGTVHLTEVDLLSTPIVINGGICYMRGVSCGDITVTDGALFADDVTCADIAMASTTGNGIHGHNIRCADLTLAGGAGSQEVDIVGLQAFGRLVSTSTFDLWSVTDAVFRLPHPESVSRLALSNLADFDLRATILGADRHGIVFDACVDGEVYAHIVDPSQETDDTYDGISIQGASDLLDIRGSIRGARTQASNPRYGVDVGASATAIDLWLAITGAQTGDINDQTTGEVTTH